MLRSLHYPPSLVLSIGTILGDCGATTWWAIAYFRFSQFAWFGKVTSFEKRFMAAARQVLSIRKNIPTFPHPTPYPAVTLGCISDIWLGLAIARKHPDVNRYVVLGIVLAVSTMKNLFLGSVVSYVGLVSPFLARHFKASSAAAALLCLLFTETWTRLQCKKENRRLALLAPETEIAID